MKYLHLYAALKSRGRRWGDENAQRLSDMRRESRPGPNSEGESVVVEPITEEDPESAIWDAVADEVHRRVSRNRLVVLK